jgi:hypothetical protein
MNNKSCPPWGKTSSGGKISKTSDAGLRNLAKRHLPGGTSPTSVEVAEFKTLQQDIDALTHADAATKKTAFTPTRTLLQQLSTSHSTLSEGDLVGVSGFLHRAENGSAAETVNCGGADGRDIHLNPAGSAARLDKARATAGSVSAPGRPRREASRSRHRRPHVRQRTSGEL